MSFEPFGAALRALGKLQFYSDFFAFYFKISLDIVLLTSCFFSIFYLCAELLALALPAERRQRFYRTLHPLLFFASLCAVFSVAGLKTARWLHFHLGNIPFAHTFWILQAAATVWAVLTLLKIFLFIRKIFALKRVLRAGKDRSTDRLFRKALKRLALSGKVKLLEVPFNLSPCSWGLGTHYVLFPQGYKKRYSKNERLCLFLHELTHIKNGDVRGNFLFELLSVFFGVNPLFSLSAQRTKNSREILCDLAVIRSCPIDALGYGRLLVREVKSANPMLTAFGGPPSNIELRMQAILNGPTHDLKKGRFLPVLCLLASLALTLTLPRTGQRESFLHVTYADGTRQVEPLAGHQRKDKKLLQKLDIERGNNDIYGLFVLDFFFYWEGALGSYHASQVSTLAEWQQGEG